jgi:UDP-N-acetylmuramate--alanine ligase
MLAELMRTKYSIAIAGSHGKTTTTSLISHILMEAKLDPTIIIGGHLKTISTNAHLGNGDFLVAEADESDRSLLRLHTTLAIVTNIDLEHLETYRDLDDIKKTFRHFLSNLPFYGKAIVCIDDTNIQSILPIPYIKTMKYGIENWQQADLYAREINLAPDHSTFSVWQQEKKHPLGTLRLDMPGQHNVLNALAAVILSLDLGISFKQIAKALTTFKGIERRFCYKGSFKNVEIFDDYGHHPTEILNTLTVAKKRAKKSLTVVFQPHRYTRTCKLWDHFVKLFAESQVDHLVITDIYPASESPIEGITSHRLVEAIKQENPHLSISYVPYEPHFNSIKKQLDSILNPGGLLLLLGAGKVNMLAQELL